MKNQCNPLAKNLGPDCLGVPPIPWFRTLAAALVVSLMAGCTNGFPFSSDSSNSLNATPQLVGMDQWPSSLIYDQGALADTNANSLGFAVRYLSSFGTGQTFNVNNHLDPSRLYLYWNARSLESQIDPLSGIDVNIDTESSLNAAILALKYYGACPEVANVKVISVSGPDLSGSYIYHGWPYRDDSRQFKLQPDQMSYLFGETANIQMMNLDPGDTDQNSVVSNRYGNIGNYFKYADLATRFKKSNPKVPNSAAEKASFLGSVVTSLNQNRPVVIALWVDRSFGSVTGNGLVPMPDITNLSVIGGASFAIVGYGNYNSNNPSAYYFKCINSYGSSWGDHGYCYFPEEYITNVNIFNEEAYSTWFSSPLP